MTQKDKPCKEEKGLQVLEEICDNTRAIRRVVNRILDHLHEYQTGTSASENSHYDADEFAWDDLDNNDDMYL